MLNTYSRRWFQTFLGRVDPAIVAREMGFLERQLPSQNFSRVLDLCCGPGRHTAPLVAAGYEVNALDRDAGVVAAANTAAWPGRPGNAYVGDMRAIPLRDARLDAVICMWQSFGHFDDATNRDVLSEMRRVVRPRGRVVLDVYHLVFHQGHLPERSLDRDGVRVTERRVLRGDRLFVSLEYRAPDGTTETDEFEWRVYSPAELTAECARVGLGLRGAYTRFDEECPATETEQRMQLVFMREI